MHFCQKVLSSGNTFLAIKSFNLYKMHKSIFRAVIDQKCLFFLFVAFIFASDNPIYGQGNLMVYPTRLVFNGTKDRIQIVNLSNTGTESTTYNLSYIENRMREDGQLEIIEKSDPGQKVASPYLRFYPRTITLGPGETQVVKVQLMRINELSRGEYRSHLYFRPIMKPEELKVAVPSPTEGMTISLKPVYGISIANIVLIDNPELQVQISNLAIDIEADNQNIFLKMDLHRQGDASSFGDVSVEYISPEGKTFMVSEKKGLAVYTPGSIRKDRLRLKIIEGVNYNEGKIIVRYRSQGPDKIVLAENSLDL